MQKANPELDIDPEVIDRVLEFDEAYHALKKIYPNLQFPHRDSNALDEFREYLCDGFSVCSKKLQNLIMQDDKQPFTEDELHELSYTLHGRSPHAVKVDRALKALLTKDVRKWMKNPNRLDISGVDDPSSAARPE